MIDHDASPGPLTRCQITGSEALELVIDLGHQAPCDALLAPEQLGQPEQTFPLRLMFCPSSGLAQLDYVAPPRQVYPREYPYRAGISWPVVQALTELAEGCVGAGFAGENDLVVDVGCNDGTLLAAFQQRGCRVVGVEPTNVAKLAAERGIDVCQQFFGESLAADIVSFAGRAKLVTMTNVFAHMGDLGEVMRGLVRLLDDDGVFISESHYLLDVLEKNQFDTVYHEHIRTYSLKALMALFPQYGLEVFDVARTARYGGNIQVKVARQGVRPIDASVGELVALEEASGLHRMDSWHAFAGRCRRQRDAFMRWLYGARMRGESIAGNSCPGRCATLLNWYGVSSDQMPYLAELPTSLKIGKYLPGRHIPVVNNERVLRDQPDNLVLLAWHYAEEIRGRLRREGVTSRLIKPLPEFSIMEVA